MAEAEQLRTRKELQRRLPQLWLSLLTQLTTEVPEWFAMKGANSALTGTGDVDSIAPVRSWDDIADVFCGWAKAERLGPVVICPHAPYLLHMLAVSDLRPEVFELDVNSRKIYFGSTLFRPEDIAHLAVLDPLGYRRLRAGAEGVLKLIQNGSTRSGRPNPGALASKRVVELLESDPEGAHLFSERFGFGAGAIRRTVDSVIEGGWDRRALFAGKAWCVARAVREPDAIAARVRFRWQRNHCPVLRTVVTGQRKVDSPATWLGEVGLTHEVRT